MAMLNRRRALDFWPGFVGALAALLLVTVFGLLIFAVGQFMITDVITGRDRALARLDAELSARTDRLQKESSTRQRAEATIGELSETLTGTERERDALRARALELDAALSATDIELNDQREQNTRLRATNDKLAQRVEFLTTELAVSEIH